MDRSEDRRPPAIRVLAPLLAGLLVALLIIPAGPAGASGGDAGRKYRNPLNLRTPAGMAVETCADPAVLRSREPGDDRWLLYCTTDPLSADDRTPEGDLIFRLLPIFESRDLVNWTYVGDVFDERPEWMGAGGPWAPEPVYHDGLYYVYYTAPDLPGGGSAIGVATSPSPTGPWTDSGGPVVERHAPDGSPDAFRWVFDPEVITADGTRYIYYGSYFGGLSVRELSSDGLESDPSTQVQVAIANRYEGTQILRRGRYYYLLASATDCCRGPLTGYSVFAGRSTSPTGPFVDRDGVSLLEARVGGTPVISMNGNRWVGTGHHDVLTDFSGQQWMAYHAIDRHDPYVDVTINLNKRPVLLDPLDWVNGWPTVRGGKWASDTRQPAPAAQPGQHSAYRPRRHSRDRLGRYLPRYSDGFGGNTLDDAWTWVREPHADTFEVSQGALTWQLQKADLFVDSNTASVLTRRAPSGSYAVKTRVRLDVPADGCCYNYSQAGLVIYGDDDNFVKLVHFSLWETRQTEFAKEEAPVPDGYPRYGNTVVGPPGEWTHLRIVKHARRGADRYTAYTRRNGGRWVRGGTWTHELGRGERIGLVAMAEPMDGEFVAEFDSVRVHRRGRHR